MERLFPDLRHDAAIGAVRYWDASVDDARLVETLVRTAVSYGAHAASRTQVLDLQTTTGGAVTGAEVVDLETGERIDVRARAVINATGVWTEQTESLAGAEGGLRVLASKGIHIVVPRSRIAGDVGLILQTEKSVLFIIPWSRYWVIGTTDTPWEQELVHPVATSADIDYVIEHANAVLSRPITREDIIGTWAGLRPLLQPAGQGGHQQSRRCRASTPSPPRRPGLTVIAGGKLTTYRVMAKDAVDFAIGSRATSLPSITHDLPLVGAEGLQVFQRQARAIGQKYGWSRPRMDHLLHRYGSLLGELIDLVDADPSLAEPLRERRRVHRRGDRLRGQPRGCAAPRRRAHAPHAAQLRAGGQGRRRAGGDRRPRRPRPRLGRRDQRSREIEAYRARCGGRGRRRARAGRRRGREGPAARRRRRADARATSRPTAGTKPGSPRGKGALRAGRHLNDSPRSVRGAHVTTTSVRKGRQWTTQWERPSSPR